MFSNTEPAGRHGPASRFASSSIGEYPPGALLPPEPRQGHERRQLAFVEGMAIVALVAAMVLELGLALGLY